MLAGALTCYIIKQKKTRKSTDEEELTIFKNELFGWSKIDIVSDFKDG